MLNVCRRVVFLGSAVVSIAAGIVVQFTGVVMVDVRHASTGELLLVLALTSAPVATMAAMRLAPVRRSTAWADQLPRSSPTPQAVHSLRRCE